MRHHIDIVGKRYGHWIVLAKDDNHKYQRAHFLCKCQCGSEKVIAGTELRQGSTKSCGCQKAILLSQSKSSHGMSRTLIYGLWNKMLSRCNNPRDPSYSRYGGRGIKVCNNWKQFKHFFKDMGMPPSADHSIDRIDNNSNYAPGNCRWATKKCQANNRRDNIIIEFNGEKKTIAQWADQFKMSRTMLYQRNHRGFHPTQLFQPTKVPAKEIR